MTNIADKIDSVLQTIEDTVGKPEEGKPLVLHEPWLDGTNSWLYLKDCIDKNWVSSNGHWVNEFESRLAKYTKAKYSIAVCNGTVGLRLALHIVGVDAESEVLIPPISFVATANAVSHLKAIPHFVDIDPFTLGMSPISLSRRLNDIAIKKDGLVINKETGRRISAIVAVHVFGDPAEIDSLKEIADEWDLPLVEDAAEALGSWYKNTHCGLIGDVGVISFNGNKLITTGGGGTVITNDENIAEKAKHLSTTAKIAHPWKFEHDDIGWNDRMPNINAALGVAQMENLQERLNKKLQLFKRYKQNFEEFKDLEIIESINNCKTNHWLISLRIRSIEPTEAQNIIDKILENAVKRNIFLRPIWKPLHKLSMYENCPRGSLYEAEDQACRIINLPSSPQILNTAGTITN
ncbi:MAG: aminotransferase DegT [Rhodopirellula sp.]|nr:aminotransferase DegT [Rhodopirellula sp.]|tara:strand:+ start:1645 stop:2862 length:1218 start_codon:yes stop_codon:yes gene_type:complete